MLQQVLLITLPALAIVLVIGIILIRIYENIRCRYDATVNCWFCNHNSRVRYVDRNSWTCPACEQYNGFTKDGDYNRDVLQQRDTSGSSSREASICANAYYPDALAGTASAMQQTANNGLCDQCNESQRLKIEKLSQFEPRHESRFDRELKVYKEQLEHQFRLCSSCERHVNRVLHEKKKMVLSSKILNFLIKGAAVLKQPHFNRLASAQRQQKLHRYQLWMCLVTVCNIVCVLSMLPPATREQFHAVLGEHLGSALFCLYSHVVALACVTADAVVGMLGGAAEQRAAVASSKLMLYARTFGKLLLYSGGLSQQQLQQATFSSCFIGIYPYAMLALSLCHKLTNGLRLTRFTLVLLLWSVYAMGIALLLPHIDGITFILLGSVATLVLLATNRANLLSQLHQDESASESFHRLCADECITDEDTLGMISEQLSTCSQSGGGSPSSGISSLHQQQRNFLPAGSVRNLSHVSPLSGISSTLRPRGLSRHTRKSPTGLSMESLHLSSRHAPSTRAAPSTANWRTGASAPESLHSPVSHWYKQLNLNGQTMQQLNGRSTQSLLMPSRLPVPQSERDVGAWVVTHSINPSVYEQCGGGKQKEQQEQQQQLSRTSSQSSGFESQPRPESALWNQPTTAAAAAAASDYGAPLGAPSPGLSYAAAAGTTNWDYPARQPSCSRMGMTLQPGDLLRNWVEGRAQLH